MKSMMKCLIKSNPNLISGRINAISVGNSAHAMAGISRYRKSRRHLVSAARHNLPQSVLINSFITLQVYHNATTSAKSGSFFRAGVCRRHRPPAFHGGASGLAAARNSAADNPAGSQASAKRGCIRASPAASRKTCASTSPMKTRPTIRPNLSTPAGTTRTTPPAPRRSPRMAPVAAAAPGFPRSGVSTAQKRTRSSPRAIVSPSTTRHSAGGESPAAERKTGAAKATAASRKEARFTGTFYQNSTAAGIAAANPSNAGRG